MPYVQPDFGLLTQQALQPAKLGVVDAFFAPRLTAYDAALAWKYMGRLKPGSFKNDLSRTIYDVMTGVPGTAKESFVIELPGDLSMNLIEPTADAYNLAAGNNSRIPLLSTANPVQAAVSTTVAAAPAPTTTQIQLTSAVGFNIGDEIQVVAAGGTYYTFITAKVGNLIDVYPKFPTAPASTNPVNKVFGNRISTGGVLVQRVALRIIAAFTDGSQIVTYVPDCRSEGIADDYKDGKTEIELPIKFQPFGLKSSVYNDTITAEKILLTAAVAIPYD